MSRATRLFTPAHRLCRSAAPMLGLLRALQLTLLLTCGSATTPALACISVPLRGQVALDVPLSAQPKGLVQRPHERTLRAGDLLTLTVPKAARLTVWPDAGTAGPALVALDEKTYLELSAQGGGRPVPDGQMMGFPRSFQARHTWQRFGAARPGTAYIHIGLRGRRQLIRVEVGPPVEAVRGSLRRVTEDMQAEPVLIGHYDRIEIELPGEPGDGWAIPPESDTGLRLLAIEPVGTDAGPSSPHRVRLRLRPVSTQGLERFEVKGPHGSYTFTVRRIATPVC